MRMTTRVIVKKLIRRWSISSSARCCDRHALLMISWFTTMSQKNVSDNGSDWCSDTRRRSLSINLASLISIGKRGFRPPDPWVIEFSYYTHMEECTRSRTTHLAYNEVDDIGPLYILPKRRLSPLYNVKFSHTNSWNSVFASMARYSVQVMHKQTLPHHT